MSRRGSSMFAQGGAAPSAPPAGNAKRQSVVLQPMAGGLGLDFDSDFSDSEDERGPQQSPAPPAASTGSNDRPMVGGFAAAAYEAAKAYHLQNKDKKKGSSKRSGR